MLQSFILTAKQKNLRKTFDSNGIVVLPNLVPTEVIDSYVNNFWLKTFKFNDENSRQKNIDQMYLKYPAIRDLLLHDSITSSLLDLDLCLALHSDITHWRSTNTGWHIDRLEDNPNRADQYVGIWVALDEIDPTSGPFQYIEGSHKWKLDSEMCSQNQESGMLQMCEKAMDENKHQVKTFLATKGDVLIWNSRVIHRGSSPKRNIPRPTLIGHFSNRWTWSESPKRPTKREVLKTMKTDPSMKRHGSGWFQDTSAR